MKFTHLLLLLASSLFITAGCSAVQFDSNYSDLATKASAIDHDAANRAAAGQLSPTEAAAIIAADAKLWDDILAASQGTTTTQPTSP